MMSKKGLLIVAAIVVGAALLSILLYTMLANHRPAITSLQAEPDIVSPSRSCQILCNATDADGDELVYEWSAGAGEITGQGAEVTWTAPSSTGPYNVTVKVADNRGGEVMRQLPVIVNRSPTISSLTADAAWTLPSTSIRITCDASDPDYDRLSYEWTATGGAIVGTGAAVNWSAPQEIGVYNLTVVVRDVYGSEDTRSVSLAVALGTPPAIEQLIVTAKDHKYLRESTAGGDYDVWIKKEYYINCIASGIGELVYEWSCDDGQISGEGLTIIWTSPDKRSIEITVTVIVSDATGTTVEKIVLTVPSCTCGSWGLN
jgi:hypothetical protein